MKKVLLPLALIACTLPCLAFASCKKDPPDNKEHEHVWDEGSVIKEGKCDPTTQEETEGEIIYTCTICGEKKSETVSGHNWQEITGAREPATCVKPGVSVYQCKNCRKNERRSLPIDPDAHLRESGEGRIVTVPTDARDGEVEWTCVRCGKQAETEAITYAAYAAKVAEAKRKVDSFKSSDFGTGSILTDLGGSYAAPPVNPTRGQHPRVLFTSANVEGMKAELYDKRSTVASDLFRTGVRTPTDGKLGDASANFSEEILNNIQILALDYQLTGNKISGYSAINAIKNVLKTMGDWTSMGDYTRYYGYAMYITACVYDWCYDLMDKPDRDQIVLGAQEKLCRNMEMGFPPSGNAAINGHGCEYQLLRDYLSFAIAIYDEYPGWWNYIGGRFYEDFVPIRDVFYEAGMAPQGVSLYLQTRYASDLYSAWLIYGMSGTIPYNSADMKQVARTIFSHELPGRYGGKYYVGFNTGDDHVPDGSFINYGRVALISSYLFDDATMRAELEYYKTCYSDFSVAFGSGGVSVSEYLICSSSSLKAAADRHEEMDLILYNGGWLGQTIARNSWGDDQAAVLMKIGVKTTANHDHLDAGQFQIFYREILSGDTGAYVKYGEDHHYYYHQATIAHNSLLIYNPSFEKDSIYQGKDKNYYYTGGQNFLKAGEIPKTNYEAWMTGTKYITGAVTGHQAGYADAARTAPTYAYIAGDIAAAYPSSTVSEVTRRMLAVFDTRNADVPMYFFVFDNITAKNASYKKTFLLHTVTEPTVNQTAKTVTEVVGGGKLVLQNVIGNNVTITTRGGAGKNYLVNRNGQDSYVQLDNEYNRNDGYWGRVEISPATGNATDQLLNVMYVCDADKTPNLTATAISTDVVKGAVIGKTAAVFVTSATRRDSAFSFTASGAGTLNYYVSGVKAGTWTVTVDGQTGSQTVAATEEGGFLTFTAPAGRSVTLTPN